MNLVFDFGGVLLRWRPRVLLRQALAHLVRSEAEVDALVRDIFQGFGGDWAEFDLGRVQVDELVQRIAQRTGLARADVRAVVQAVPNELQPVSQAVALLEALALRGHRLFYLSNMPAPYADHIEREHRFIDHFVQGIFSARVGLIKPDAAIFSLADARFGLAGAATLFIDDHPANIAAAHAHGWQALHFTQASAAHLALAQRGLL